MSEVESIEQGAGPATPSLPEVHASIPVLAGVPWWRKMLAFGGPGVLGSAIALNLLFGLPLTWGVCVTAADVLLILLLQHRGFRLVEALVAALILTIGACFFIEIVFARPDWGSVGRGFIPTTRLFRD